VKGSKVIALSDYETPVDIAWRGYELETPDAADMIFEYRDRSLDEAEETLREESEYWHGMSEVGDEWFFQQEN
jgi:hypothetical protein